MKCVEDNIRNVMRIELIKSRDKLPSMYLLDSIIKNVGGVYIELFGLNLYRTFTFAFLKSDEVIQQKLQKVLMLWNNIFDKSLLSPLHEFIEEIKISKEKDKEVKSTPQQDATNIPIPPLILNVGLTAADLLNEIQYLIAQKQSDYLRVRNITSQANINNQIIVLQHLAQFVHSNASKLTMSQMEPIRQQLRVMSPPSNGISPNVLSQLGGGPSPATTIVDSSSSIAANPISSVESLGQLSLKGDLNK